MATPVIELRDVQLSFGPTRVLRGVDLTVEAGTTLVVMGESGSGKSVLLKTMIGLIKPDHGEVLIDGVDIAPLDERALQPIRMHFGMVFQSSALFDGISVFENVAFPLRERFPHLTAAELEQRVLAKLELFNLAEARALLPEELSGGMKKRVALARAIVLDPRVLLYDEPTTGLDPITSESVAQMILKAKKALGVTSVAICQDLASAFEIADQLAFLHDGRIVARGTPEEMRASREPEVHRFLALWEESVAAARADDGATRT